MPRSLRGKVAINIDDDVGGVGDEDINGAGGPCCHNRCIRDDPALRSAKSHRPVA